MSTKYTFMSLPGELRNQIYEHILDSGLKYVPHTLPPLWPSQEVRIRPGPGILQLNRQIRQEVLPMIITRHLSIDLRGHDGEEQGFDIRRYKNDKSAAECVEAPEVDNAGLRMFDAFLDKCANAQLVKAITKLEVCDFIEVCPSGHERYTFHPSRKGRLNHVNEGRIANGHPQGTSKIVFASPAFQFGVEDGGDRIVLRAPLCLDKYYRAYIDGHVEASVRQAIKTGQVLDGMCIMGIVRMLRKSGFSNILHSLHVQSGGQVASVQCFMLCDDKDVDAHTGRLLVNGFEHVVVDISISEMQKVEAV